VASICRDGLVATCEAVDGVSLWCLDDPMSLEVRSGM
jgi:hypothetical protein